MATTIRMLGYGTADGIDVPISFSLAQNQSDPGLLALALEIPHFDSYFRYDPDFSVILSNQQQQQDSSSSSPTTDNLLPLLSLLVLLIFPTALLSVAIIIAFLVWARRRHLLRATRKGMTGNVTLSRRVHGDEDNAL